MGLTEQQHRALEILLNGANRANQDYLNSVTPKPIESAKPIDQSYNPTGLSKKIGQFSEGAYGFSGGIDQPSLEDKLEVQGGLSGEVLKNEQREGISGKSSGGGISSGGFSAQSRKINIFPIIFYGSIFYFLKIKKVF